MSTEETEAIAERKKNKKETKSKCRVNQGEVLSVYSATSPSG
jgi:hypothetical protein